MKEDLPYSLLPFQKGREGTAQVSPVASAMCLGGYKGRESLYMQFLHKWLSNFLKARVLSPFLSKKPR